MAAKSNVESPGAASRSASPHKPAPQSLEAELAEARAEIARLNEEIADLQLLSQATMEHGEAIEDQLAEKNDMLEQLSTKLSKYLSPQVYNSIFTGRQEVAISATRKKLTIFFSDIADFTSTTESLESEELTALLNHYLTEMSRIALEHGATIDKYIGDAIVAFFGDPETRGARGDALACVKMAIAMQRRMHKLQLKWLERGTEKPFRLRIGINTGFCTVGNFGSEDRMDYTMIGNAVNLAARLQSHAEIGTHPARPRDLFPGQGRDRRRGAGADHGQGHRSPGAHLPGAGRHRRHRVRDLPSQRQRPAYRGLSAQAAARGSGRGDRRGRDPARQAEGQAPAPLNRDAMACFDGTAHRPPAAAGGDPP